MVGYRTRWARPQDVGDDPERIAIREALAFGKTGAFTDESVTSIPYHTSRRKQTYASDVR
jgi:hypothetical protein